MILSGKSEMSKSFSDCTVDDSDYFNLGVVAPPPFHLHSVDNIITSTTLSYHPQRNDEVE